MTNKHFHGAVLIVIVAWTLVTPPAHSDTSSRRLVGPVMALLAVFEQANVLPAETAPEANQLIHALIQTQAALTKSADSATRRWFLNALRLDNLAHPVLTSRALEAILGHAAVHPPEENPAVLAGFRKFNVGPADFALMTRVYEAAVARLRANGQDIHVLYDAERQKMPFR
jgi:hypothetical protein